MNYLEIASGQIPNHRAHSIYAQQKDAVAFKKDTRFLVPALTNAYIVNVNINVEGGASAVVALEIESRSRISVPRRSFYLEGSTLDKDFALPLHVPAGSVIRLSIIRSTGISLRVSGGYDLILIDDTK